MNKVLILAGLVAFASTPALAKPDHAKGHGNGHGNNHREGWGTYGAWGNSCPPGLAKKHNGCRPPGQARKRYNVGQRWSNNYGQAWSYNQIPYDWRQQYGLRTSDRYYYRDGYLYQVNPRTSLVTRVLSAILR